VISSNIYNTDCITGMHKHLKDSSVDLTITSIPFEELFTYSGKAEDVGNNGSTIDIRRGRFILNLAFVINQLLRVTKPGCNVCIHIQQLLAYKNQHGFQGRRDFRGAVIDAFIRDGGIAPHLAGDDGELLPILSGDDRYQGPGFHFIGEFVVPKDPQAMAQRLNLHSLQFKTGYGRDARNLAPAPNDYVLIFQKPGESLPPVRCLLHTRKNPDGWVTTDEWVRWARGVWDDIDEFDIIDGARHAKENDQEKHVCPLQLEVVRRCIRLYTNPASIQPGVTVLDPFMGVGSTAAMAIEMGRNAVGFELKESYFRAAIANASRFLKRGEKGTQEPPSLFGPMEAA